MCGGGRPGAAPRTGAAGRHRRCRSRVARVIACGQTQRVDRVDDGSRGDDRGLPALLVVLAPGPAAVGSHRIPKWYRYGMSKQIAVRLPEDIVAFIDHLVDDGDAKSRAEVVTRAVDRERRREAAARDAAILARAGTDADLDGLAEYAASTPLSDLD